MHPTLNPASTRRPEISGEPVFLADGQSWYLARPSRYFLPRFQKVPGSVNDLCRKVEIDLVKGYAPAIQRWVERFRIACEARSDELARESLVELGVRLLMRAHDIPREVAVTLFRVNPQSFPRVVDAILSVVSSEVSDA